ncbi:MAG: bifunctional 2-methylcitrate dehydratase/aconitate hydratase [Gammaproteobacteria bacterium]|nr:bifunctional 2-methylcitrate dehydratase/aconitate hydratase [Gammaproteobacteria bacterium]
MKNMSQVATNFDQSMTDMVDYCFSDNDFPESSYANARLALMDAMGCAMLGLQDQHCQTHLGNLVPGMSCENGCRVPGTQLQLDPAQASYNLGCMIRWLDYNDTWLAQEWAHPSDNLATILCCADYYNRSGNRSDNSRQNHNPKTPVRKMRDVLQALIMAYEIQGVLALDNAFNVLGFDHVFLLRLASTIIAVKLLGGTKQQALNALSNAFLDGAALRTYRHAPNTGWRKSWAAADTTRRAVTLALQAIQGEMGYATALSAKQWGFNAVMLNAKNLVRKQAYTHMVIDNILYKVSWPVEFHAQTAVECAIKLHPLFKKHYAADIQKITRIDIHSQQAALRIIDKTGPLTNPADRDHCLQYAVAFALLFGKLDESSFYEKNATNPNIDLLREKIFLHEDRQYTADYLNANKRCIANRVTINFNDGNSESREVLYPIGHPQRRKEALPLLREKFIHNTQQVFPEQHSNSLLILFDEPEKFDAMNVNQWMDLWRPAEEKNSLCSA